MAHAHGLTRSETTHGSSAHRERGTNNPTLLLAQFVLRSAATGSYTIEVTLHSSTTTSYTCAQLPNFFSYCMHVCVCDCVLLIVLDAQLKMLERVAKCIQIAVRWRWRTLANIATAAAVEAATRACDTAEREAATAEAAASESADRVAATAAAAAADAAAARTTLIESSAAWIECESLRRRIAAHHASLAERRAAQQRNEARAKRQAEERTRRQARSSRRSAEQRALFAKKESKLRANAAATFALVHANRIAAEAKADAVRRS